MQSVGGAVILGTRMLILPYYAALRMPLRAISEALTLINPA